MRTPFICAFLTGLVLSLFVAADADSIAGWDGRGSKEKYLKAWALYEEPAKQLSKIGKLSEAIEMHKKAIEMYPYDSSIYFNYALDLEDIKDFAKAEVNYKLAISMRKENDSCWYNLGILQYKKGAYLDARKSFEGPNDTHAARSERQMPRST